MTTLPAAIAAAILTLTATTAPAAHPLSPHNCHIDGTGGVCTNDGHNSIGLLEPCRYPRHARITVIFHGHIGIHYSRPHVATKEYTSGPGYVMRTFVNGWTESGSPVAGSAHVRAGYPGGSWMLEANYVCESSR